MKPTTIAAAIPALVTLSFAAQKLDGTLPWPWWSWNPLSGSVLILAVLSAYVLAGALMIGLVTVIIQAIIKGRKEAAEAREKRRVADVLADLEARRRGAQGGGPFGA